MDTLEGPAAFLPYEDWAFTDLKSKPQPVQPEVWDRVEGLPKYMRGVVSVQTNYSLGVGGFATVYEGTIHHGGKTMKCAVKVPFVRHDPADGKPLIDQVAKRVAREVRLSRALVHPNIVNFHGICYDPEAFEISGPFPAMVFSYCDGGSVLKYLEKHPDTKRMPIMCGVAKGMEYLHRHGVIHGDFTPGNILIKSMDGGIRGVISDFGSAKDESEGVVSWSAGVRHYLAPEINSPGGMKVSTKSDIYAFGLTMLAVLSGREAFDGKNNAPYRLRVEKERPVREDHPCLEMEDDVWRCLEGCWAHEPAKRLDIVDVVNVCSPT